MYYRTVQVDNNQMKLMTFTALKYSQYKKKTGASKTIFKILFLTHLKLFMLCGKVICLIHKSL